MRPEETREAVEARLTVELDAARQKYDQGKRQFEAVAAQARELGLETADGTHSLFTATKEYNESLKAYKGALSRFCDFILRGKIEPGRERRSPDASKRKIS